jgi:hypothetical protein
MFRTSFLAVLCIAAVPAFAQNQTTPAPAAPAGPSADAMSAIQTAAQAFGQCVQSGALAVPATVTPEAGATTVLAGCSTQKSTLEQAVRSLLATLPAEQRTAGEAQLNAQLTALPTQVADGIRQARNQAGAPPAATPAPAQ